MPGIVCGCWCATGAVAERYFNMHGYTVDDMVVADMLDTAQVRQAITPNQQVLNEQSPLAYSIPWDFSFMPAEQTVSDTSAWLAANKHTK